MERTNNFREVCRVTTASTKTYGVLDVNDDKNCMLSVEPTAFYLMAIVETFNDGISTYGVALIDTSVGRFIVSFTFVHFLSLIGFS